MLNKSQIKDLIESLEKLITEVDGMIARISKDEHISGDPAMVGKLPMLDFYNDDLKKNLIELKRLEAEMDDE